MKKRRIVNGQLLQTNNLELQKDTMGYRSVCDAHGRVPNKEDDVQYGVIRYRENYIRKNLDF